MIFYTTWNNYVCADLSSIMDTRLSQILTSNISLHLDILVKVGFYEFEPLFDTSFYVSASLTNIPYH